MLHFLIITYETCTFRPKWQYDLKQLEIFLKYLLYTVQYLGFDHISKLSVLQLDLDLTLSIGFDIVTEVSIVFIFVSCLLEGLDDITQRLHG